jgi:cell division cycle 20-like protein 1 (cofactor of APC complex)
MEMTSPTKAHTFERGFPDMFLTPHLKQKELGLGSSNSIYMDSESTNDSASWAPSRPETPMQVEPFLMDQFENNENSFSPSDHQISNFLLPTIKKKNSVILSDRFFPNRRVSNLSSCLSPYKGQELSEPNASPLTKLYEQTLLGLNNAENAPNPQLHFDNKNMFRYREELQGITNMPLSTNYTVANFADQFQFAPRPQRKIPKTPFKVLDAPALQDDFYLNLLDWSSQNLLAVGLASTVYLWSAHTSKVMKLCDMGFTDSIASVGWSPKGVLLSVGTTSGDVHIWDSVKMKKIRTMSGHGGRVGSASWNSTILATGSRDKNILFRDIRLSSHSISKLVGHKQEVCGLKWSFDEQQLSSGGNDNKLFIWNTHSTNPVLKLSNHTAAVKALAWSPHQHGLLASGGGTADRTIRFWNTLKGTQINSIDTGSQVCALIFSKNYNELVSTHGYSQNQIMLWKYPALEKITELTGHSYRVLYLAMSPDGQTIVTGAGDETLRFWQAFPMEGRNEVVENKKTINLNSFDLR